MIPVAFAMPHSSQSSIHAVMDTFWTSWTSTMPRTPIQRDRAWASRVNKDVGLTHAKIVLCLHWDPVIQVRNQDSK